MKRILAMVMCAVLLAVLAGCGPKVEGKWTTKLGVDTIFEFKPGGVLTLSLGNRPGVTGKWAMKGDQLTLTLGDKPQECTAKFEKDTMTLTPKNASMALVLTRVKE